MGVEPEMKSIKFDVTQRTVSDILSERGRQDEKWGEQDHDAGTWALILLEEIGEWAKAELHRKFGGPDKDNAKVEMVQSSAVAMAIVECMNRHDGNLPTDIGAAKGFVDEKYNELILALSQKFDGESRHETALRYIQKAEQPSSDECKENIRGKNAR